MYHFKKPRTSRGFLITVMVQKIISDALCNFIKIQILCFIKTNRNAEQPYLHIQPYNGTTSMA